MWLFRHLLCFEVTSQILQLLGGGEKKFFIHGKHKLLYIWKGIYEYLEANVDHPFKHARVCSASQRQCIFLCPLLC